MHGLVLVHLALAGLAAHALARSAPSPVSLTKALNRRKTLGFGPDLPHTRFQPGDVHALAVDAAKGPYDVAHDFLSQYNDLRSSRTYVIRPDSYTDHATGVTHIYAHQLIGGIEVVNAHVNLNIKDGRVLSFGDSFLPGEFDYLSHVSVHPHAHHCAQLSTVLDAQRSLSQSLASDDRTGVVHGLAVLEHLYTSNCVNVPSLASTTASDEVDMDPRRPLLAFLASALPENHPELSSLSDKLEEHVNNIVMTPETHLLGEHASLGMSLSNVPGVVSEVKTRIVWIQVPTEHGVKLELVHRFEVEMERNWYETTVTTSVPHRIISVVDWVNDSPMPIPVTEPAGQLPNLGAFVPLGSIFDSVASAPVQRLHKPSDKKDVPPLPELSEASYFVFPWGTNDPVEAAQRKAEKYGEPPEADYPLSCGREIMKELGDTYASPLGWHTLPVSHDPGISEEDRAILGDSHWRTTETTWGNNVFAHENWQGGDGWVYNERPLSNADGAFSYPYSPNPASTEFESLQQARAHINASVAQLFYTSNMAHDLFYRYGFTEAAGNFQQYNFGKGGEEGDAIIADAQDLSDGYNNAAFSGPPDGLHGRIHMCLWDTNSPYPDGVMEASIVIHEISHGLSMRLTGGPKDSGCLGWGESGGMGEGWGDFIATSIRSTSTYSDYTIGAWAANAEEGVRHFPYSTDFSVNPVTYETPNKPGFFGSHALGEVWAEMLWGTQQRLIAKHGFSETLFPPVPRADGSLPPNDFYRPQTFNPHTGSPNPLVPKHGNTLLLQLVINGMKMQPCLPSFFDARDAIIGADRVLTGGENVCDIWQGFAERGLGIDAELVGSNPWGGGLRKNGFQVPPRCRSGESTAGNLNGYSLWHSFKSCAGRWISRLSWGY